MGPNNRGPRGIPQVSLIISMRVTNPRPQKK